MPPLAKGKPAQTPTTLQVDVRNDKGRFLPGNSGNGGRRPGSRNKLAEEAFNIALKLVNEGGEQAMREVMLKEPAKFCQLMVALIPQHFKVENDHTLNLSADELRSKLLEIRAKLLDSDVDPELLGPPREGNVGRE